MTPSPPTPKDALARRLRADPSSPLVTFYDDASGERVELSGATFGNWVAKLANLLRDGVGLDSDSTIRIDLPPHWQTLAVVHAAWELGAAVVLGRGEETPEADALVRHVDASATNDAQFGDVLVLALRPLAVPGAPVAEPLVDVDREVRTYGDHYSGARVDEALPAILTAEESLSHEDAAAAASAIADARPGERLAIDLAENADHPSGWIDAALVAMMNGGGVVLSVNRSIDASLDERWSIEHARSWRTIGW